MRQDARSLLERLGRAEFRYQEFDDQFADMELWPIFEALLRDPAIVGHQTSSLQPVDIQFRSTKAPAQPAAPSTLFSQYSDAPRKDAGGRASNSEDSVNLRQFFGRFSEGV